VSSWLINIVFAVMIVGVVMNKLSIRKMRLEIVASLPPSQRPNMNWWNLGRQFQMLRAYRGLPNRSRWSEIYIASSLAVIVPLVAAFVWAGVAGHK
jgi:hypothetical protein